MGVVNKMVGSHRRSLHFLKTQSSQIVNNILLFLLIVVLIILDKIILYGLILFLQRTRSINKEVLKEE